MASPLNPALVTTVTCEYLICLPPSEWLWPPTQCQARGLQSKSCTSGTEDWWLWPNKSGYGLVPSRGKMGGEPSVSC
jgi:hypothetical protein